MAVLYSQYVSGAQMPAGTIAGSSLGTSGLNPVVDRLNSITTDNCLVMGSVVSGTSTKFYGGGIISGTTTVIWASGGNVGAAGVVSGTTWIISGTNQTATGPSNISGASTNMWIGSFQGTNTMLIIENRTSDPANPATGRIWIRTDL